MTSFVHSSRWTTSHLPPPRRVTRNEAERYEENRAEREERLKLIRSEVIRQFKEKGAELPPGLREHDTD